MYQIVEMSYEEKIEMYKKCKKIDLIKMLIECNKIIAASKPTITYDNTTGQSIYTQAI